MGKTDSDQSSTKLHFSHPHTLTLIDLDQPHNRHYPLAPNQSCAGCKRGPSGSIYACTTCNNNYFVHKKCFDMPKKITHPCHDSCKFTLLTEPAYPNGLFKCDACHETSGGFSYNCKPCGVDLHILCAVMPLSTTHASHKHDLKLAFGCPYPSKDFSCDICKRPGSNHWLYRCATCGFDAHLKCARSKKAPLNATVNRSPAPLSNPQFVPPHQPQPSHHFYGPPPMNNQFVHPYNTVPSPVINGNVPAMGVPTGINGNVNMQLPQQYGGAMSRQQYQNNQTMMFLQALQQKMQNDQAFVQSMMAGGLGGVGLSNGGVNSMGGLPQLMRMMSGLNGNGGVGGGFDALQSMFGGGGGGLDFLNGGGLDFLSGGGLDFLSGGGLDMIGGFLGGF